MWTFKYIYKQTHSLPSHHVFAPKPWGFPDYFRVCGVIKFQHINDGEPAQKVDDSGIGKKQVQIGEQWWAGRWEDGERGCTETGDSNDLWYIVLHCVQWLTGSLQLTNVITKCLPATVAPKPCAPK